MSQTIELSAPIIEWLQTHIDFSQLDSRDQEMVRQWLTQETRPTYEQLIEISEKTWIPFGYFLLSEPPAEEISLDEHRTFQKMTAGHPSRELIGMYHQALSIQDWMHDDRIEMQDDPNEFVGKARNRINPVQIAEMIQEDLQISSDIDWKNTRTFSDYRTAIRHLGILVMSSRGQSTVPRSIDTEEFRGFALTDDYAPLIVVNGNNSENENTVTLLQALTYLYLNHSRLLVPIDCSKTTPNDDEQMVLAVVEELLLPAHAFKTAWKTSRKPWNDRVNELSTAFHCSPRVVVQRALDLYLIPADAYHQIVHQIREADQNKPNETSTCGEPFYHSALDTLDPHFLSCLDQSVRDGSTPYTTAYRLTGTNRKTYDDLMESLHVRETE